MMLRLICLVRRHQWHNGWDDDRHQTVLTCMRCGKTRVRFGEMDLGKIWPPGATGGGGA